MQKHIQTQT